MIFNILKNYLIFILRGIELVKLEKIINDENDEVSFRIRKSAFRSLTISEKELERLFKLIKREKGEVKD